MPPGDKASNALYWEGQAALKQSDWSTALRRFQDLENLLRKNEPKSVDAALYWEAYTLVQAKRTAEAKNTIERLRREFPDSRWSRDADTLLAQMQTGHEARPGVDRRRSRRHRDGRAAERAARARVPLLKKVLASQRSIKVKKRALFVLSQLETNEAMNVVLDAAKNAREPELRREAIRMLGMSGENDRDRASRRYLRIQQERGRKGERDRSLAGRRPQRSRAEDRPRRARSRGASTRPSRHSARWEHLTSCASCSMQRKDADNRRAIIQSLGVAGNASALKSIAGNASLPQNERVEAMHALGVAGDHGGAAALVDLYAKADTPALRDAVLQGLLISDDSDAVTKLYSNARTTEEKKALLQRTHGDG